MRKLVYSRTNEEFNNELQTMRSSQTFLKYENYAQHINERGQLRNSRVEVAENHEKRIDHAKGKLATLLQTMNNMFAERIPHDVEGYEI